MTSPGLPRLLVLTDGAACERAGRTLVATVDAAVEGGAQAVVLREKELPRAQRARLAGQLRRVLDPVGGRLHVASDVALAGEAGARGVHLAADDPWPIEGPTMLVGRSCHSRREVERAAAEGADYATLSPIFESASKPAYGPPLGVDALAGHPIPVYALGGIAPDRAGACLEAGAIGVAVMGGIMGAPDPAPATAQLLAALSRP